MGSSLLVLAGFRWVLAGFRRAEIGSLLVLVGLSSPRSDDFASAGSQVRPGNCRAAEDNSSGWEGGAGGGEKKMLSSFVFQVHPFIRVSDGARKL